MSEFKPMLTPEGRERVKWIWRTMFTVSATGLFVWLHAFTVKHFEPPLNAFEMFMAVMASVMIVLGLILTAIGFTGMLRAFSRKRKWHE